MIVYHTSTYHGRFLISMLSSIQNRSEMSQCCNWQEQAKSWLEDSAKTLTIRAQIFSEQHLLILLQGPIYWKIYPPPCWGGGGISAEKRHVARGEKNIILSFSEGGGRGINTVFGPKYRPLFFYKARGLKAHIAPPPINHPEVEIWVPSSVLDPHQFYADPDPA